MNKPQKTLSLFAGASLLVFSSLSAVTTDPVGYVTLTINGSSDGSVAYTPLSLSLEKPVQASGALSEAPTSAVVTDSSASYTVNEFAGTDAAGNATHYLQFTGSGLIVDITANTANTITADTDLSGVVDTGAGYVVKEHMTISDVFGSDNSAGFTSGGDATSSDLIYVMSSDGGGSYQTYYYQTDAFGFLGGTGWRLAGDASTDVGDTYSIPAGSSVIIKHKGSGLLWADAKPF